MRGAKSSFLLINMKQIVLCFLFLGIIFFILSLTFSSSSSSTNTKVKLPKCPSNCNKIPLALSSALLHYATTNITPQQTSHEITLTARVLHRKSPCNFLVFGLGYDSLMWATLNYGGKTVFLEEDKNWIRQIKSEFPTLDSRHVAYDTKVRHATQLLTSSKSDENCYHIAHPMESNCTLAPKSVPSDVLDVEWDVIMVDAPTGYHDDAPGRMQAIYTAGLLGRWREEGDVDVFVHDVDRDVEDVFSKEYLCEGYMVEEVGKLRHFRVPSHRSSVGRIPFCPTTNVKN
ncbi:hypothetical protein RND81_11G217800 [Saponaria officinalis]|uniref:Polysaccharide biosynthesis domain-containing protein n=1 Tax=Saponaria officinalis TaxID=3572 RepID=A0AAW1HQ43_SAPOF